MKPLVTAALVVFLLSTGAGQGRADRLVLVAGGGTGGDGSPAEKAKLITPFGIGFDPEGSLIFVEMTGERVRKIGRDGTVTTIAGTGKKGDTGDGGPALKAEFNGMHSLVVARNGDIFVADTWNNRVRKIDAKTGVITNVAGTGKKGFKEDPDPKQSEFGGVYCLALQARNLPMGSGLSGLSGGSGLARTLLGIYLADLDNRRIRIVFPEEGRVETVVGDGNKGVPANGAEARSAPLVDPRAVAVDNKGTVYVLERGGHALRAVDSQGKIRNVAGTGKAGFSGDDGPAIKAQMNGPKHLCVDSKGKVYIADTENHRIRLYDPADGTIRTVVGSGRKGTAGLDGPPTEAELNQPHGVTVGPDGLLYIADSTNNRILKVVPSNPTK
jgi:sugar lactone lactonase YvrE